MKLDNYPNPSRRSAVLARRGAVATSQPLAAQAGISMLERGGNAVDAALATAIALTVLEPTSNGIGSDAFAIVCDGGELHGLNASGRSPRALSAEALTEAGHSTFPERGWPSVTVPGAPDSWLVLHERFGKLPIDCLFEPAIRYARDGFAVSPVISMLWRNATPTFLGTGDPALDGWGPTFASSGQGPVAGDVWASPGHADTLERMARVGIRDFYEGELAARVLEFSDQTGGLLVEDDLRAHRSEWVELIGADYQGYRVWEIPPNGQGIAALEALAILDPMEESRNGTGDPQTWHFQIEAMKLAFADTYRYVADPEHGDVPTAGMLDPDYVASRRALIGEDARVPEAGRPPGGGTIYLCTADGDGQMVSFIQSNYAGFGSGVVVPDTGISLQNRGACFTMEPGHLNVAAGGKRPRHTIIPAFLSRGDVPIGPFGVMGGEMQPQGHLQVAAAMIDDGFNPQAALDAPRWRVGEGTEVHVEPEVSAATIAALEARGHRIVVAPDRIGFGRGQGIVRLDSGVYAVGTEPRTDGAALGL